MGQKIRKQGENHGRIRGEQIEKGGEAREESGEHSGKWETREN